MNLVKGVRKRMFSRLGKIIRANVNSLIDEKFTPSNRSSYADTDGYSTFESRSHSNKEHHSSSSRTELLQEEQYYANLELPPGSDFAEIKKAYRRLLKKYHPDRHQIDPERKQAALEISQRLNEAYDYFEKKHKQ